MYSSIRISWKSRPSDVDSVRGFKICAASYSEYTSTGLSGCHVTSLVEMWH